MILVDSSVWIEHFRKGGPLLRDLLSEGVVITHPFVIGELACGNLTNRTSILSDLNALPIAISATHDEVLRLVEDRSSGGSEASEGGPTNARASKSGTPRWRSTDRNGRPS